MGGCGNRWSSIDSTLSEFTHTRGSRCFLFFATPGSLRISAFFQHKEYPMREITSHKVNGLNEALTIQATDQPGPGNANHRYEITGFDIRHHVSTSDPGPKFSRCLVIFQDGPLQESSANGISNEAMLAIVEDRLKGFQSGGFACRENAIALTKIQEAMHWLHHRTRDRMSRGVEGTNQQ